MLALCSGLQAQSAMMTASIPFEFQSGKDQMPAGEYTERLLSLGDHDNHGPLPRRFGRVQRARLPSRLAIFQAFTASEDPICQL